jgi:hypothetical protein
MEKVVPSQLSNIGCYNGQYKKCIGQSIAQVLIKKKTISIWAICSQLRVYSLQSDAITWDDDDITILWYTANVEH